MRISIPSLPLNKHLGPTVVELNNAAEKLRTHLEGNRRVLAITGAGVSVDSGISSYRGENGLYSTYIIVTKKIRGIDQSIFRSLFKKVRQVKRSVAGTGRDLIWDTYLYE